MANIVSITINTSHFINVYSSPNEHNKDIIHPILDEITNILPNHDVPVVTGGDFNTGTTTYKSTLFMNKAHDTRIQYFDDFIVSYTLKQAN